MENTQEINNLWNEMKDTKSENSSKNAEGRFKSIPDGTYTGYVFIKSDKVANKTSPNYGLNKYEIQLTVTEGAEKGKMAYRHYVIIPHNLAIQPPKEKVSEFNNWKAAVKSQLREIDIILTKCGVDTNVSDTTELVQKIAENNRRKTKVNFTVKDENPYVNHPIEKDETESPLFQPETLPDGNDLPLN